MSVALDGGYFLRYHCFFFIRICREVISKMFWISICSADFLLDLSIICLSGRKFKINIDRGVNCRICRR